ncbi:MAG TPA: MerR family transcriptional regulator, partial [Polyangiales bacterium]
VSQLAAAARVPVARIKFYLRERLLPPPNLRAAKRAYYDASHVQRLRLIHTLRHTAGLGVPAVADVCRQLDDPRGRDLSSVVLGVIDGLARRERTNRGADARSIGRAHAEVLALMKEHDMLVRPDARALRDLAAALVGLRQVLGPDVSARALSPYLTAMRSLAAQDFSATEHLIVDPNSAGLAATYGIVLWEPILVLLRRIAHEHVATTRLSGRARKRVVR